jgi:hypothetical protein
MQFLAQLSLQGVEEADAHQDQTLLLFQCQAEPGMCDDWDASSGGNAALLVDAVNRVPMTVPAGETLLPAESRLRFVQYAQRAGDSPDDAYCDACDAPGSQVVGKLGGSPLWIQDDETPTCECGAMMKFIAQLERHGGGGINFGGEGAGYAFLCPQCRQSAKFLWQCT